MLLSGSFCQLLLEKAGASILQHPASDSSRRCCPEPTQPRCPPAAPTPAHLFSPWQVQQDRAAFHPQHAGQGCTNGAQGVTSCRQKPVETCKRNRRLHRTDGSSSSKTLQSCSTCRATPGNVSHVGCPVPSAGLAQAWLVTGPAAGTGWSAALSTRQTPCRCTEGWCSLSPGCHWMSLESTRITRIGSVPLHRCLCHQGNRCQRCRDPWVALRPLALSVSICPPTAAVGRRSPNPRSLARAEQDEELQRPVHSAK